MMKGQVDYFGNSNVYFAFYNGDKVLDTNTYWTFINNFYDYSGLYIIILKILIILFLSIGPVYMIFQIIL